MKKRAVWKVLVLGIITFCIYDIYWFYVTRKELIAKGGGAIPRVFWVFLPVIICMLASIALGVALAVFSEPQAQVDGSIYYQSPESNPPIALIIGLAFTAIGSAIASVPIGVYFLYKYSKAVEKVTGGHTSFDTSFILGLVLNFFSAGFVMPAILQDSFNKFDAK